MNFFNYIFNDTYAGTIWLYNLIFAFVTGFAFLAQKRYKAKPGAKNIWFFLSFLFAWFFFAFNNTGSDLSNYIAQYEQSSLTAAFIFAAGLETGYRLIIALLHTAIENPYVGIGILKTIQLALIYGCVFKLRDKISVGYSIMAYMALFYFASFNIFRLSLAGSLALLSYVLLLEKKRFKSIVTILLACTIHSSVVIYAIALATYFCYLGFKKIRSLFRFVVLLAVPIVVFFGRDIIFFVLQSGFFMDRYVDYATAESTFGVMQIIFYLPVFYVLIRDSKNASADYYDVNFIFSLAGFAVALIGYIVGMLSRTAILFSGPFLFYIPQYLKHRTLGNHFPNHLAIISIIMLVYWIGRYILSISGYFITSGLYPFQFVF